MHRSLWWSLGFGNIGDDLEGQQRWFDQYRKEFNLERPHEALGGKPSQEVWVRSPREYDGELPKVEYPSGEKICFVSTHGNISVNGRKIFLSVSLRGEYVWLEEADDDRYLIRFCQMPLACYYPKNTELLALKMAKSVTYVTGPYKVGLTVSGGTSALRLDDQAR